MAARAEAYPEVAGFWFTAFAAGQPQQVSPEFLAYTGLPADAPPGAWMAKVHVKDLGPILSLFEASQAGRRLEGVARILGRDGRMRAFALRARLIDGPDGRRWYGTGGLVGDRESAPKLDQSFCRIAAGVEESCVAIDRDWRVIDITPKAAQWIGLSVEQALGLHVVEDVGLPRPLTKAVAASLANGRPSRGVYPSMLRPGRWTAYQVLPHCDGANILAWDVTDQRSRHGDVEEASTRGVDVVLLDAQGTVVSVSSTARSRGADPGIVEPQFVVGAAYADVCHWLAPDLERPALEKALRELKAGRRLSFTHAYAAAGGARRQMKIMALRPGPDAQLIAIHDDAPAETNSREALEAASEQVLSAREDERHRIAIELHDSTSQHLVALGLGVARLQRLATMGPVARDVLADMTHCLQEAVKEIRVLSYLMNPPDLTCGGLQHVAQRFVVGFGARTGLRTTFHAHGQVDASNPAVRHTAFRVIQEALANVYRHAEAKAVEVELTHRGGVLTLRIADDGKGMPRSATGEAVPLGVGIPGMRTRVEQLGGQLEIASSEGAGAVLTARLPLRPRRPSARNVLDRTLRSPGRAPRLSGA